MESKKTNFVKISLILMLVGIVLMVIGFLLGPKSGIYLYKNGISFDDRELVTIKESDLDIFTSIDISSNYSNIEIIESDSYGLEIRTIDNVKWSIENDSLKIDYSKKSIKKFFSLDLSNFFRENEYIKVYLPKGALLDSLKIDADAGNININNIPINDIYIDSDFGDITINNLKTINMSVANNAGNLTCKKIDAEQIILNSDFGDMSLKDINTNSINIESNAGNVTLNNCNTKNLSVQSDFGNVSANNIVSTITDVTVNAGNITLDGDFLGNTKLKADFGNISFNTKQDKSYYTYNFSVDFGNVSIDGKKVSHITSSSSVSSDSVLDVSVNSGNIGVYFKK